MTVKQKRAIGYAIRARDAAYRERLIDAHGLRDAFKRSGYKSTLWFLKARGINPYYVGRGDK